jgi:catechol 2,3-dioxygenase-like lactoylglutathione lyase family enzyme
LEEQITIGESRNQPTRPNRRGRRWLRRSRNDRQTQPKTCSNKPLSQNLTQQPPRTSVDESSKLGGAVSSAPSLHHVAVGTHDVQALARFYCQLLQADERRRHVDDAGKLRSIWLDLAGIWLMIERAEAGAARPAVEGVGLGAFLLAFRADASERRAFEERAAALGAAVESRSASTSYLRDPDGNRIAVSEYEVAP